MSRVIEARIGMQCSWLFYAEKYGITPERSHSSSPVETMVIEAARQLPLYFSRFFVVKVSYRSSSHFWSPL